MKNKGFSLIELMVVVCILGIIAALAMSSMGSYLLNAKVRSATEDFQQALTLAKSEAIKRNDTVKFTSLGFGGWKIEAYVNDVLTTVKTKPASAGSKTTVTGANAVVKFDGSGRSDVATTWDFTPTSGGACGTEITCLRVELTRFGKLRVCNPDSTNEVLKCN